MPGTLGVNLAAADNGAPLMCYNVRNHGVKRVEIGSVEVGRV